MDYNRNKKLIQNSNKKKKENSKLTQNQKSNEKKCCMLKKRKDPVPKLRDVIVKHKTDVHEAKNHVHENIVWVKTMKKPQHPLVIQDSSDGHRQNIEKAGLQLKYVFKKEYGRTPSYIKRKQEEYLRARQEQQEKCTESVKNKIRTVSDEEKHMVLKGLENNLCEVERRLLALPVILDTISKQKRKEMLEKRLVELQQNIEVLKKNDVIIIREDCE